MQFCNIFMTFWWNEIIAMLGKLHELKHKRPKGLNRARFAEVKASAHRSALEIKVIAYILGTRTSIFFPNHESVMNHPNGFRNVFVKRSLLYLSPPLPLSLSLSLCLSLSGSRYLNILFFVLSNQAQIDGKIPIFACAAQQNRHKYTALDTQAWTK